MGGGGKGKQGNLLALDGLPLADAQAPQLEGALTRVGQSQEGNIRIGGDAKRPTEVGVTKGNALSHTGGFDKHRVLGEVLHGTGKRPARGQGKCG